jgi:hypothetical protein
MTRLKTRCSQTNCRKTAVKVMPELLWVHEPVETDSTKQHVSTFLRNELLARETESITVRARLISQDYANSVMGN